MLLSAESQRNKTTVLLCMATLLGYSWDEHDNVRFLGDEEFVKKGQALRKSLSQTRAADMEIVKGNHLLVIDVKDGKASVAYGVANSSDERSFNLHRGWEPFEHYMNSLVDVQLVSKGRNFIERVELDILNDIKVLGEKLTGDSQPALTRLILQSARPRQRQTAGQMDRQAIESQIGDVQTTLQQKEDERKHYVGQRAAIHDIVGYLKQLGGDSRQAIERLYRLERDLHAAEDAKHQKADHQKRLQEKEGEVKQLKRRYQDLDAKKKAVGDAFGGLQIEIDRLLDQRRISTSPEEDFLTYIKNSDVQGVCNAFHKGLGTESLEVYRSLIRAVEDNASPEIVLLPLGDDIRDAASLLSRLQEHLEKAENLVPINEAIEKFMQRLQKTDINLGMTPLDYQTLENEVSDYAKELQQAEGELKEEQQTQPMVAGEQDTNALRTQIEQMRKSLTKEVQETRENLEDTVKTLEGPSDEHLNRVWSANAISYLQEREREVEGVLRRLRRQQRELEQQKYQLEEQLLMKAQSTQIEKAAERADHIRQFIENVSYVIEVANARTDENRQSEDVQKALRYLDEVGLAQLLKETIDSLITKRCQYYYDNSGETCNPLPLEAVIYEQIGRDTPRFRVGGLDRDLNRANLSGGTESVMTVRSLVSRPSSKAFGVVLLVDEWGDVEQIGEPLYDELKQMDNILAAVFVKVEEIPELTAQAMN